MSNLNGHVVPAAVDRLRDLLKLGPLSRSQIDARFSSRGAVGKALVHLYRQGEIETPSRGTWQLVNGPHAQRIAPPPTLPCPDRCGRPVKPGNTYASQGCVTRHRQQTKYGRGKSPQFRNYPAPVPMREGGIEQIAIQPKPKAAGSSWWIGTSREEFMALAAERFPTVTAGRCDG